MTAQQRKAAIQNLIKLYEADLGSILKNVIESSEAGKKIVEGTKASFESLKNIKIEDEEFAKSAKVEATISALTNAKLKVLDILAKQPKNALQFVAANIAVKAKKA